MEKNINRNNFEKWAKENGLNTSISSQICTYPPQLGPYDSKETQKAWLNWTNNPDNPENQDFEGGPVTDKKNPDYFIQEAAKTVVQRGKENGYDKDEERSARSVAVMFNEMHPGFNLTDDHIWDILLCLKLKRNANQPREDNIIDLIGYASLRGESQSAPKKVKPSLHEKRGPSIDARSLRALPVCPCKHSIEDKGWFLVPENGIKTPPIKVAELGDAFIITSDCLNYFHKGLVYSKDKWELKEYK